MLFSWFFFLFILEGLILCDHAHTSTCVTGSIKFFDISLCSDRHGGKSLKTLLFFQAKCGNEV